MNFQNVSNRATIAGQPNNRTTEQGKIELLSQWTMEGCDEQYYSNTELFAHLWCEHLVHVLSDALPCYLIWRAEEMNQDQ